MNKNWRPYYAEKKKEVLERITPLLQSVGNNDFEYIQEFNNDRFDAVPKETLRIYETYIGCTGNSVEAVVREAINYIWVTRIGYHDYIGAFKNQTLRALTQYWRDKL